MADKTPLYKDDRKRGKSEISSVSELDSSVNTPPSKKQPYKKKTKKVETTENSQEDLTKIRADLSQINKKLNNVMTKDDGNLRDMIREMIKQMKEELLQSVIRKVEILEINVFQKEQDNDNLKEEIIQLNKTIETQKEENNDLRIKVENNSNQANEYMNDIEQYSRSNNIRINGIPEEDKNENAYQTTQKVIKALNGKFPQIQLSHDDIDIAHRLGPKKPHKKRQVIVKFISRFSKNTVMNNLRNFKGSQMFITEDLTGLNQDAFMCVKNKMSDDIKSVWTRNGKIFYENKTGSIHHVRFSEYQNWFDLPWQEIERPRKMKQTEPIKVVVSHNDETKTKQK